MLWRAVLIVGLPFVLGLVIWAIVLQAALTSDHPNTGQILFWAVIGSAQLLLAVIQGFRVGRELARQGRTKND